LQRNRQVLPARLRLPPPLAASHPLQPIILGTQLV
jgi:hypothetical protein